MIGLTARWIDAVELDVLAVERGVVLPGDERADLAASSLNSTV
jgi:hypothetical protein